MVNKIRRGNQYFSRQRLCRIRCSQIAVRNQPVMVEPRISCMFGPAPEQCRWNEMCPLREIDRDVGNGGRNGLLFSKEKGLTLTGQPP
jgi:hypothetical protein